MDSSPGFASEEFPDIPDLVSLDAAPAIAPSALLVKDATGSTGAAIDVDATPLIGEPSADATKTVIPLTILTGWLGAGKTTFLHHLLTELGGQGKKVAILQNETSTLMGVERSLALSDPSGALGEVMELSNGCVCCSVRSDFSAAIEELLSRRSFDLVVVECSGIADPGRVANSLWADDELEGRVYLDGIVAFVDTPALAGSTFDPLSASARLPSASPVAGDAPSAAAASLARTVASDAAAAAGLAEINGLSEATAAAAAAGALTSEASASLDDVAAMVALQITDADVVVLNKIDLLPDVTPSQAAALTSPSSPESDALPPAAASALARVSASVRQLNPSASQVTAVRSRAPLAQVLGRRALRTGAGTAAAVDRAFAAEAAAAGTQDEGKGEGEGACGTDCTHAHDHSHDAHSHDHSHDHDHAHTHTARVGSRSSKGLASSSKGAVETVGKWEVTRTAGGSDHGLTTLLLRRVFSPNSSPSTAQQQQQSGDQAGDQGGFCAEKLRQWLTVVLDETNLAYTTDALLAAAAAAAATTTTSAGDSTSPPPSATTATPSSSGGSVAGPPASGGSSVAGRVTALRPRSPHAAPPGTFFLRTKGVLPVSGDPRRWYVQAVREVYELGPASAHVVIDAADAAEVAAAGGNAASAAAAAAARDVWPSGSTREARIAVIGMGLDAAFICNGLEGCVATADAAGQE